MADEELRATDLVSKYFLEPGESIQRMHASGRCIEVHTDHHMWVLSQENTSNERFGCGWHVLCDVSPSMTGLPWPRRGVAVLPDGRTFYLNDADEFRAFFLVARSVLEPLELAWHLVTYQSKDGGHEGIIMSPEEVLSMLPEDRVRAISVAAPDFKALSDGSMAWTFDTNLLTATTDYYEMSLNRWQVDIDVEGRMEWRTIPIARGLECSSIFGSDD